MNVMNASTAATLAAQGVNYAPEIAGAAARHGLFQIDDRWHDFAGTSAAMDPGANAEYAAGMISGLLQQCGGNVHEALSAYNAGSPNATGTKTTWGDGQTLGYADSVLRHEAQLGGTSAPTTPLEDAQAEQSCTSSNINALLTLSQLQGGGASPMAMPSMTPWQPPQGYDPTGHKTSDPTDYVSYVSGDASDSDSN